MRKFSLIACVAGFWQYLLLPSLVTFLRNSRRRPRLPSLARRLRQLRALALNIFPVPVSPFPLAPKPCLALSNLQARLLFLVPVSPSPIPCSSLPAVSWQIPCNFPHLALFLKIAFPLAPKCRQVLKNLLVPRFLLARRFLPVLWRWPRFRHLAA